MKKHPLFGSGLVAAVVIAALVGLCGVMVANAATNVSLTINYATTAAFSVGDAWNLRVSGPSRTSFTFCANQNNTQYPSCTANFGTTDANGNWTLTGSFRSADIGSWVESVNLSNSSASSQISFTVTSTPNSANSPASANAANITNTTVACVTPYQPSNLMFGTQCFTPDYRFYALAAGQSPTPFDSPYYALVPTEATYQTNVLHLVQSVPPAATVATSTISVVPINDTVWSALNTYAKDLVIQDGLSLEDVTMSNWARDPQTGVWLYVGPGAPPTGAQLAQDVAAYLAATGIDVRTNITADMSLDQITRLCAARTAFGNQYGALAQTYAGGTWTNVTGIGPMTSDEYMIYYHKFVAKDQYQSNLSSATSGPSLATTQSSSSWSQVLQQSAQQLQEIQSQMTLLQQNGISGADLSALFSPTINQISQSLANIQNSATTAANAQPQTLTQAQAGGTVPLYGSSSTLAAIQGSSDAILQESAQQLQEIQSQMTLLQQNGISASDLADLFSPAISRISQNVAGVQNNVSGNTSSTAPTSTAATTTTTSLGTYRYIKINTTEDSGWIDWREIEVYGPSGKIAIVSSTVGQIPSANWTPSWNCTPQGCGSKPQDAYDGDIYTGWNGAYSGSNGAPTKCVVLAGVPNPHAYTQWITLDLGSSQPIMEVRMMMGGSDNTCGVHQILGSNNGTNFTLIHEISGNFNDRQWIGYQSASPNVISIVPPTNDALIQSVTVPATASPGQQFTATVVVKNTGQTTWVKNDAHPYRLGYQSISPGYGNLNWGLGSRVELPVDQVAPSGTAIFVFTATAPSASSGLSGYLPFTWQMVWEGVRWFGNSSGRYIQVQ